MEIDATDLRQTEMEIFLQTGLDRANHLDAVVENRVCADQVQRLTAARRRASGWGSQYLLSEANPAYPARVDTPADEIRPNITRSLSFHAEPLC
jgi:hypothetical protein